MPACTRRWIWIAAPLCLSLLACGSSSPSDAPDSGGDAGADSGADAGFDAGTDGGADAGSDAGADAGLTSVDCADAGGLCPTIAIAGESPAAGSFHGYADPSLRKDPNTSLLHMAWSWPINLANGTRNVELHLGHSADQGATWSRDGVLFSSRAVSHPGGAGYAAANQSSDEVVDLFPIDLGAQKTRWVQAHLAYLVPTGSLATYAQLDTTSYVSVSAVSVGPGDGPAKLLELGTAPEARLGNKGTDASLSPTANLSALPGAAANNCTNFNQPALFAQGGTLYLIVQCFEAVGGDGKAASHFVYSTTPTGDDARAWTWQFVGIFATPQEAVKLGDAEGATFQFFTELQVAVGASGQLLAILTPAISTPTAQQAATQYGCRAVPMTLNPPALGLDAAGVPKVLAKVIESDLYGGLNQGNGACAYEPSSKTGIVIVRKLESDPQLGFYVSLEASGLRP